MSSRSFIKTILKGDLPPTPCFIPIVFTLASKIENIPLTVFLSNPTRLVSALREFQGFLKSDGIIAYFNTSLEAEACGCKLDRTFHPSKILSHPLKEGASPEALAQVDVLSKGRIPIALETIKRLRSLIRDQAIVSSITGPITLTFYLYGENFKDVVPPSAAFNVAGNIALQLTRAYCEAGIDLLLIVEEEMPKTVNESLIGILRDLLRPVCNVAKYFEVLPVLMVQADIGESALNHLFNIDTSCFVFSKVINLNLIEDLAIKKEKTFAIPIPLNFLSLKRDELSSKLKALLPKGLQSYTRCAFITTGGEIPHNINLELFNESIKFIREAIYAT